MPSNLLKRWKFDLTVYVKIELKQYFMLPYHSISSVPLLFIKGVPYLEIWALTIDLITQ